MHKANCHDVASIGTQRQYWSSTNTSRKARRDRCGCAAVTGSNHLRPVHVFYPEEFDQSPTMPSTRKPRSYVANARPCLGFHPGAQEPLLKEHHQNSVPWMLLPLLVEPEMHTSQPWQLQQGTNAEGTPLAPKKTCQTKGNSTVRRSIRPHTRDPHKSNRGLSISCANNGTHKHATHAPWVCFEPLVTPWPEICSIPSPPVGLVHMYAPLLMGSTLTLFSSARGVLRTCGPTPQVGGAMSKFGPDVVRTEWRIPMVTLRFATPTVQPRWLQDGISLPWCGHTSSQSSSHLIKEEATVSISQFAGSPDLDPPWTPGLENPEPIHSRKCASPGRSNWSLLPIDAPIPLSHTPPICSPGLPWQNPQGFWRRPLLIRVGLDASSRQGHCY